MDSHQHSRRYRKPAFPTHWTGRPASAVVSALGRTPEQFADIKASVGDRAWYSMFQGVPSSPTGGLVKRDWLDQWRLPCAPSHSVFTVVGVDPSDWAAAISAGWWPRR